MREFVHTSVEIDLVATDRVAAEVAEIFGSAPLEKIESYAGGNAQFASRHRVREADGRFLLRSVPVEKSELYGTMVRSLMAEQLAAIRNPDSPRLVTGANGVSSLAYAVEAQRLAQGTGQ